MGQFNTAIDTLKKLKHNIYSSRKMIFYQFPFTQLEAERVKHDNFNFRTMADSDYEGMKAFLAVQSEKETVFHPTFDAHDAISRVNQGEYCFICEDGDHIIAYVWYAPGKRYIKEIAATISPHDGWLYTYLAYVDPRYRSQNVMKYLSLAAMQNLRDRGYLGSIACRMDWNLSAHGTLTKQGYSEIGYVKSGYIFTFHYLKNTCKHISVTNARGILGQHKQASN